MSKRWWERQGMYLEGNHMADQKVELQERERDVYGGGGDRDVDRVLCGRIM